MKGTRDDRGSARQAILDRTAQLMTTVPLHSIKVAALCRDCGVNRTTFYDHFHDIYDVADKLGRTLADELAALCDQVRATTPSDPEITEAFLDFFSERHALVAALLSNETAPDVMRSLNELTTALFEEHIRTCYDAASVSDEDLADLLSFATAGFYHFFLDREQNSPERLARRARLTTAFCSAGLERSLGAPSGGQAAPRPGA